MKQNKSQLNDNEEGSFNGSLYYQKNLIFVVNKIDPEITNYNNNDYYEAPYIGDDQNDIQWSNFLGENQEQTENSQSSSKSISKMCFIIGTINDSIKKEEEKSLNKKRKREKMFNIENRKNFINKNNNNDLIKKEEEKLLNKKRKREKMFNIENRKNFIDRNNNHDLIKKEEEKLLNKKRKREKILDTKKTQNRLKKKERKKEKIFYFKKIKKYQQGRRGKLDNDKRKHNCNSEDNIINKIKTHFFHYIRDIISKNSNNENEKVKIIKFQKEFVANLKKDINIELLETKLVDILRNQKISTKNKNSDKDQNKTIIDKIYVEKKEERVMKILELEFKELLIIFRRKLNKPEDEKELKKIEKKIEGLDLITNDDYDDTKYLIDDIEKQNSKNNRMNERELEEYIEKVKECCKNYEKWFYDKIEKTKKIK